MATFGAAKTNCIIGRSGAGKRLRSLRALSSLQKIQFNHEGEAGDVRAELIGEFGGGERGAAGGEQIIDD